MRITVNEQMINPIDYMVFIGVIIALVSLNKRRLDKKKLADNPDFKPIEFSKREKAIILARAICVVIGGFMILFANTLLPLTIV